jgi:hypothetical protein
MVVSRTNRRRCARGRLLPVGTPVEVVERPASVTAAQLLG